MSDSRTSAPSPRRWPAPTTAWVRARKPRRACGKTSRKRAGTRPQRDAGGAFTDFYMALSHIEETFELVGVSMAIIALSAMFRVRRTDDTLTARFDGYRTP